MSLSDIIRFFVPKMMEPMKRFLLRKPIMPTEKATPSQALKWCQNFLCGAWSTITVEQLQMTRVTGGLSNYLFCCSLPDDIETQHNEPRKVLLRIYGETHQRHRGALLIDSVVCTLLSERKLGPHVYGIFPEGRLEEMVDAVALVPSEFRDVATSHTIGRLLGELHQLDMPLIKEPIWLFRTTERYLSEVPTDLSKFQTDEDRKIFKELLSVCNFAEEFQNLKNILATVDSPVCFTHNDFQPGNILRLKSQPDNFTVIDFEYCSYNYRGFDIGNHFCEFMFDYQSATAWPFFKVNFKLYPNDAQQMTFLSSYADATIANEERILQSMADITNGLDSKRVGLDRSELARIIMKEANYFALASNFFWTLWSINMAISTTIKFGYMEYGRARLTAYYLLRDMLTGANDNKQMQMPPQFTEDLLRSPKNPFYKTYIENN